MRHTAPNTFFYGIARVVSNLAARLLFRRRFLRNEIKNAPGPFVVIANHQTALDFVNLIGACKKPMNFVVSRSIFGTLPLQGFLSKLGLIPKQQFQTEVSDLKKMKSVVASGGRLAIYPAGLMCEDGLSTPIPEATYKFLKWLGTDVYVARSYGSYFVLPKWSSVLRPGRTYIDIYKLFSAQELAAMDEESIRLRTEKALLFDAYREQEGYRVRFSGCRNIAGLEDVLYICPHCGEEFSIRLKCKNILQCEKCGYAQQSDDYAMLHKCSVHGEELRYVSDWSRLIFNKVLSSVEKGELTSISSPSVFCSLEEGKHRFRPVGSGTLSLNSQGFRIEGEIDGEFADILVPIKNIPSLPFSPGKYLEVQHGSKIYRCILEDGRLVMKFINLLKSFHALSSTAKV